MSHVAVHPYSQVPRATTPGSSLLQTAASAALDDHRLELNPTARAFVSQLPEPSDGDMSPLNGEQPAAATGEMNGQATAGHGLSEDLRIPGLSREEVLAGVKKQIEYYFSKVNLTGDKFLKSNMDKDGFVKLALLATFKQVRKFTSDVDVIAEAVKDSSTIELCEGRQAVRPMQTRRTLFLRYVPDQCTEQHVRSLFDGSLLPSYLSVERVNDSMYYVTFRREVDATDAYNHLSRRDVHIGPVCVRLGASLKSDPISRDGGSQLASPATPPQQPYPQPPAVPMQLLQYPAQPSVFPNSSSSPAPSVILSMPSLLHSTANQCDRPNSTPLQHNSLLPGWQQSQQQYYPAPLVWPNYTQLDVVWGGSLMQPGGAQPPPSGAPPPRPAYRQQGHRGGRQSSNGPRAEPRAYQQPNRHTEPGRHTDGYRHTDRGYRHTDNYRQQSAAGREPYRPPPRIEKLQRDQEHGAASGHVTSQFNGRREPAQMTTHTTAAQSRAAPTEARSDTQTRLDASSKYRAGAARRRRDERPPGASGAAPGQRPAGTGPQSFELDSSSFPALTQLDESRANQEPCSDHQPTKQPTQWPPAVSAPPVVDAGASRLSYAAMVQTERAADDPEPADCKHEPAPDGDSPAAQPVVA